MEFECIYKKISKWEPTISLNNFDRCLTQYLSSMSSITNLFLAKHASIINCQRIDLPKCTNPMHLIHKYIYRSVYRHERNVL